MQWYTRWTVAVLSYIACAMVFAGNRHVCFPVLIASNAAPLAFAAANLCRCFGIGIYRGRTAYLTWRWRARWKIPCLVAGVSIYGTGSTTLPIVMMNDGRSHHCRLATNPFPLLSIRCNNSMESSRLPSPSRQKLHTMPNGGQRFNPHL